ncbi:MAG TPA: SRPBCC family protein [Magnetospirillaceae bacterium]
MKPIRISATAISAADTARVFDALADGASWPSWSIFDSVELERPGQGTPHGVGAIRIFVTKVSRAREEVVELIPGRRLSYILLAGLPLRDYRAVVELESTPSGGTQITWSASFFPKYWGTGWFWSVLLTRTLTTVSGQLAAAAQSQRSTAAVGAT